MGYIPMDDDLLELAMGPAMPLAADTEPPRATTSARAAALVDALRKSSPSPDHCICMILANRLGFKAMEGMSLFVECCRASHGRALQQAMSPAETRELRIDGALGGWKVELLKICEQTADEGALVEASFVSAQEACHVSKEVLDEDHHFATISHRF